MKMHVILVTAALAFALGLAASGTQPVSPSQAQRRTPVVVAVERAAPAVVNVSTEQIVVVRDPFYGMSNGNEFFERFFGPSVPRRVQTTSLGSGAIVDPAGFAVTNAHVVAQASRIHVTLADGTESEADLVAQSRESDLALVRLREPRSYPFIRVGSSGDLMIGETAIAVGNPFGLEHTVTTGVISAKNRSIRERGQVVFSDILQTDCAINPGNSGGPLLGITGDLIGINTAIYSSGTGIGFAIPADRVKRHLAAWLDEETVGTAWTGIALADKAAIAAIRPGSPAAQAGLAPGDVLVSADGHPVADGFDLRVAMFEKRPGDSLGLEVSRGNDTLRATLTLADVPPSPAIAVAKARIGIAVTAAGAGTGSGVLVTAVEPDGPGGRIGVIAGDAIVRLGKAERSGRRSTVRLAPVQSLDDLRRFLDVVEAGDRVHITVLRDGQELSGELVAR